MSYTSPTIPASGATFATFRAGLAGHLELFIAALKDGTAAPTTAPSVAAAGGGATGGGLAAGDYKLVVTETNGLGETTAGAEAAFTAAAGDVPRVTFNALQAGNTARNVYLTLAGGASGTELLYATGITAGTFDLGYAHPALGVPAPSSAPTVATGTAYGGQLLPGGYRVVNTELNGAGESIASAESAQFTVSQQSAPTGTPTVVVSGSGGTLPAGVYSGKITYVDSNVGPYGPDGETPAGTEFTFTQTSGAEPVITFNDGGLPAWSSGRNLYLTPADGASGTEVLAVTGLAGTTYTITQAPPVSPVVPPASNTTSTNQPVVTPAALQPGNSARSYYVTAAGGASGTEVLYASDSSASTLTLTLPGPASAATPPGAAQASTQAQAPPTVNRTGLSWTDASGVVHDRKYQLLRAVEKGDLQSVWGVLRRVQTTFAAGDPAGQQEVLAAWHDCHAVFSTLAQLCAEGGALIDANPGFLGTVPDSIGNRKTARMWL